jgi:serine protease Do
MRKARRACLLALLLARPLPAQDLDLGKEEEARRALRRSPVVEVYHKCQPSVVCLTFPIPKGGNASVNEFFAVPGVAEDTGVGSAFVLHESGYLLTNAHAVSTIATTAHLANGEALPADVVGVDRSLDLAVVRVRTDHPLRPLPLARGTDTMIGETVVIIGSPHGLRQSCVTGVVGGLGRIVNIPGLTLHNMVQLSAGINPGNSGGPALNIVGEVLGVVAVQKPDSHSIAFAVPAAVVRKALPRLLDAERRQGVVTGLTFAGDGSRRVKEVADDSPAAAAGICPGDVLRRVEGWPVVTESDFDLRLLGRKPGDVLGLSLWRPGETVEVRLRLGRRPKPDAEALLARLGLKGTALDARKAGAMRLRQAKGVLLSEVQASLYPEKQKPEPGDVLARINDVRPDDLDHVGRLLADAPAGQPLRLVFVRQREKTVTRMDVTLTPPKQ